MTWHVLAKLFKARFPSRLWSMRRDIFCAWLCFLVLVFVSHPAATQVDGIILDTYPTPKEFEQLPRFCFVQRTHSGDPTAASAVGGLTPELKAEGERWRALLGSGVWGAMHHYCAGLARVGRYRKSLELGVGGPGNLTNRQRVTLEMALGEFQFMAGHMEKDRSIIYPDWALNQAIVYRALEQNAKAKERLLAAIGFKNDYEPAYLELASLLEQEWNRPEAITILEIGLAKTNGSAAIRAKLEGLRGK